MNAVTITLLAAGLLALVSVVLYATRRAMVKFEIRIRDGKAQLRSGSPRAAFLSDVQEIVTRNDVDRATIRGVGSGPRQRLMFDGSISDHAQQQIRNAWSVLR